MLAVYLEKRGEEEVVAESIGLDKQFEGTGRLAAVRVGVRREKPLGGI